MYFALCTNDYIPFYVLLFFPINNTSGRISISVYIYIKVLHSFYLFFIYLFFCFILFNDHGVFY